MKKKSLRVVAAIAASTLLVACGGQSSKGAKDGDKKPVVLTTFTVLADMAKEVGGDHLKIESITSPGEEIHDFQPSPDDIKRGADADLILENGLGLERWFKKFTEKSPAKKATLSKGIKPIAITEDAHAGEPNPHAWMSPKSALTYVDNLVSAFSDLDPDNADDYKKNGENYKKRITEISENMKNKLASVPEGQRALVTCEGAFSYLAQDYGLREQFLWAVNAEGALTPKRVALVKEYVETNKIPAVFCESTVEGKMDSIVQSTSAKYGGTLYVDSLTKADGPAPTYLDLLRYDTETISKALSGEAGAK